MMALLQQFGFSIAGLLAGVVNYGYYILFGCIIASIVLNWLFPGYPSSSFMQAVYDAVRAVSNPILMPIRSRLPTLNLGGFGLDLSPIVAIIALSIARSLLLVIVDEFVRPVTG